MTKIIAIVLLFILIFGLNLNLLGNYDIWWHLKTGELAWENKQIQREDLFSANAQGREYIPHEWLFQIIAFLLFESWGWTALLIFKSAIVTLALYFIFTSIPKSNFYISYIITLISAFACLYVSFIRPHVFMWLFLAMMWWLVYRKRYWFLPLLFLAWANFHSSVLLAALCISAILGERIWFRKEYNLVPVLALTLIAPLISGAGINAYLYAFKIYGVSSEYVAEWNPLPINSIYFALLVVGTLFIIATYLLDYKKTKPSEIAITLGALYLAYTSNRNAFGLVFFVAPILILKLNRIMRERRVTSFRMGTSKNIFLAIITLILLLISINHLDAFNTADFSRNRFPGKAVEFMKENNIQGNIFNSYGYGGFLTYHLYPESLIQMDGRNDVYGKELLDEYVAVLILHPQWKDLLNKYNTSIVFVDHKRDKLDSALAKYKQEWKLVYIDNLVSIYVKRLPEFEKLREFEVITPGTMSVPHDNETLAKLVDEMEYALILNNDGNNFYRRNLGMIYLYEYANKEKALQYFNEYLEIEPGGEFAQDVKEMKEKIE